jgi:hypothetical protein
MSGALNSMLTAPDSKFPHCHSLESHTALEMLSLGSNCLYSTVDNKPSVETVVSTLIPWIKGRFYRSLSTTISPVGAVLPPSGSMEMPRELKEPIAASEVTISTLCPFSSTVSKPALTGASPISQTW